jgi:hypothetical protein
VEKRREAVDILWTVAAVAFASAAIAWAAVWAWATGSLELAVSASALFAGAAAAGIAVHGVRGAGLAPTVAGSRILDALALAAFAAAATRQFGWIVYERGGALLTLLPYNYGDLPLHWTYVAHLAGGATFWPENPVLSGERLRYPFGVDLLTAVFVQLGVGIPALLRLMGLAGAALAALALRRWGGPLAVAGFLFSGGLAGFEVLWTGRVEDYQSAVAWKNLFLSLLVPQRGFLLALPAGLLLLWSWRRRLLRGEAGLPSWVEGLVWGALPLVHLHTFLFVSLLYATWAIGARRVRAALPALGWALVPAGWSVWQVTDGFRAASLVGWQPGWVMGTMGSANPAAFLLVNFGLFLPLALVALALALREKRREDALLLGPALSIFAGLFLVRLAPWAWDNTKVLLWCWVVALPPIDSVVLARLARPWRAGLVFGLLFSGSVSVLAASRESGLHLRVLERAEYEGVCRALAGVPTRRVATAQTFNHPVALCGRPIVAGYGGHLWSHGLDAREIERRLGRLMRGEPGWREDARALGASHVFWGPREREAWPASAQPWRLGGAPAASGDWGALYRLD